MNNNNLKTKSKNKTHFFYRKKPESLKLRHTGISTLVDLSFDSIGLITIKQIESEKPKEKNVRNGKVRS